tara:strand:+ start:2135 stop:2656 length:522 start_codon:yes stop_codon:yes gene_type:complete
MIQEKQPRFDAPIPGMSLTHELGARPWQQPAQFTTVEEVVDHYTTRMMNNDEFSEQLVDVMDMGIPLTTIANTIQLAGVMEGKHSVDTGLLALPVLIETMMLIGDTAGVKYNTGMDDVPSKERETLAKRTIEKLKQEESKKGNEEEEIIPEDANMVEEINKEEEPMGLMQRRG